MQATTVALDGLDLHVHTGGHGEPVLFVHGLGSQAASWLPTAEALSDEFALLVPDLPGFGRSSKPPASYEPAFFVDALVGLLEERGIEATHVVGTSLGGHIALELALRHPERVHRTVAVAPGGVPPADFEGTPALARYTEILEAETEDQIVTILEDVRAEDAAPRQHVRDPAEILAYVQSPGAAHAFRSALVQSARARRLGPLLDGIEPGPLIVWGEKDPMIPWQVTAPVLAKAKAPTVALFEECGHSPHNQRPEAFRELAAAFLAERASDLEPVAKQVPAAVRLNPGRGP